MRLGDARTDGALVRAYLSGDRDALGALYDRFGAGLYDTAAAMLGDRHGAADIVQDVFCVAATKLGQLRDPDRVKPWLFAVARHEIYRRTKKRKRDGQSLDAMIEARGGEEPMADGDSDAADVAGAAMMSSELASLVRDAAAGLAPDDQLVLELSARQGLVGADLAAAMGVSTGQASSILFRMRDRLERAVGAVVVTRSGRRRCAELAAVLAGWDGTFNVLWRKRISRHIDGCETCQETRRGAAVLSLAGAAPAFAAPIGLRDRVLDAARAAGPGGGPRRAGRHRRDGYGFDAGTGGFPAAVSRSGRGPLLPLLAVLTAAFAIVLTMAGLSRRGVAGAVSPDLAVPVATSTTATTSTTTSTTSTSTTTSTSSTTSTTTVPRVGGAPIDPNRPTEPPTDPRPATTAAPARSATATTSTPTGPPATTPTTAGTTTTAATTTTTTATRPTTTEPLRLGVVTTTTTEPLRLGVVTTTRPLRLAVVTTTTAPPVPAIARPVLVQATTTTIDPPR